MKIGIEAHSLEGNRSGVGRVLINLLQKAAQTPEIRNKFRFYLYFKKEIPQDDFLNQPIFVKRLLNLPAKRSSFTIFFLFLLPWALKKDKIDLAFFPSYMIPLTFFGKSVVTIHDLAYENHPELFSWRYLIPYKVFSRYGAYQSKKILAVSNFSKSEIVKYYHTNPDKILVTYLGIREKFKPINNENILKQVKDKYRIKDKFIFQLGQIFVRRYVDKSILAFSKIADKFPDYQLLVVGKNMTTSPFIDIDGLIKKVNQKHNREVVLHQSYAPEEDLVPLYNAAEISVYLSDYEGFGLPPLEAMACATPVITTNLTALKETAGHSALLVNNPKNIDQIAGAFSNCLSNQALREELIKKGLKNVKRFSWQKCAEQTFNLFYSLK